MKFLSLIIICLSLIPINLFSQESLKQTLVVVFDNSGSMEEYLEGSNERKISVAKNCLINSISKLPTGSKLGLILINNTKTIEEESINKIDSNTYNKINSIEAFGGTHLSTPIIVGANLLLKERQKYKNEIYRLLIITDGEAEDVDIVGLKVLEIMSRGITVDCIGLNMKKNHSLSNKVSHYMNANTKVQLFDSINQSLAEVSDTNSTVGDFAMLEGLSNEDSSSIIYMLSETGNNEITNDLFAPIFETPLSVDNSIINWDKFYFVIKVFSKAIVFGIIIMLIFFVISLFVKN